VRITKPQKKSYLIFSARLFFQMLLPHLSPRCRKTKLICKQVKYFLDVHGIHFVKYIRANIRHGPHNIFESRILPGLSHFSSINNGVTILLIILVKYSNPWPLKGCPDKTRARKKVTEGQFPAKSPASGTLAVGHFKPKIELP